MSDVNNQTDNVIMAASYAETLKAPAGAMGGTENTTGDTNENFDESGDTDTGLTGVKPVFILEKDLFGTIKPEPKDYLNHVELYRIIDNVISGSHL